MNNIHQVNGIVGSPFVIECEILQEDIKITSVIVKKRQPMKYSYGLVWVCFVVLILTIYLDLRNYWTIFFIIASIAGILGAIVQSCNCAWSNPSKYG